MGNYYKALVIVPLVVLLGLGVLYFYLDLSSPGVSPEYNESAREVVQQEKSSTVSVGTGEVSTDSAFDRIEGEYIYYSERGVEKTTKVSSDEMVIACTSQDLGGLTELDFSAIASIKPVTPNEVGNLINPGTFVVVLANQVDDEYIAHTIAVNNLTLCE